ncbi:hypothetical protein [Ferruginibacter sp. HRS2-29]|uniref:hypothetical protein n=1 Tax=Ferruginibacter sp. HRS2-29 TaxID=2487334 RepID=UPI0020CD310F|nr:hypothetical protein [Ferruginibacter sp. HRS2-29]MCP9752357.1 hypothetical protein [Ferruginibacter sp. HRS2-29]
MLYQVELLTTIADCDQKLAETAKEKQDLEVKKIQTERKYETAGENTPKIETDIIGTEAEINAIAPAIASLPEGDLKKSYENKLRTLQSKLYTLNLRLANYSTMALLEQAFQINCLERSIVEADALIAAVTARKAQL